VTGSARTTDASDAAAIGIRVFAGPGEMRERCRALDWAATPLGPVERWPQSLRSAVALMLAMPQPAYVAWGPDACSLYNDGYVPILGAKHPDALGRPYREVWPEIWDAFRPVLGATMRGEAHYFVDQLVPLAGRAGTPESWFTFSWTPLRDEQGQVAGFFCVATETTDAVLAREARRASEARQAFLLRLSDELRAEPDEGAIGTLGTRRLADHLQLARGYVARLSPEEDRVVVGPEYRRPDLGPASGEYRLSDFPEVVRQVRTQTVVITDVAGDAALTAADKAALGAIDIGAFVTAGVREGDARMLWALVVVSTAPRAWTPGEVALVETVAERAWAAVERARSEAARRSSEARYRTLVESVRDYAIYLVDVGGAVAEWTAGAERVKGYTAAEVLGRDVALFYGRDDVGAGEPDRVLAEAAATGRAEREGWLVRKGGERFWGNEIATAVRDADGALVGFTKV